MHRKCVAINTHTHTLTPRMLFYHLQAIVLSCSTIVHINLTAIIQPLIAVIPHIKKPAVLLQHNVTLHTPNFIMMVKHQNKNYVDFRF